MTARAAPEAGRAGSATPGPPQVTTTEGVVLVSMPFDSPFQPSIGLSLLKAALAPLAIPVQILYLTLRFAERIGTSTYAEIVRLTSSVRDLAGDWVFAAALFDPTHLDEAAYVNDIVRRGWPARDSDAAREAFIDRLLDVRAQVDSFLDQSVEHIASCRPGLVGFTSVFQQQVASLALAKRLKERCPGIFVVFGGANCEGVMGAEVVRQFPFVDAVVSGEGDLIFSELVQRVLHTEPVSDLTGVYTRRNVDAMALNAAYQNAPPVKDLDALPIPDYDDFFDQLRASRLDRRYPASIMFETSRGCWWGERSHCTFCGLSDATMPFRGKSARRAVDELVHLTSRYPGCAVVGVDWILNVRAFDDFLPELAARRLDVELFYEVKANLKKAQVRLLRDAGVRVIQPGIESFSSNVLQRMRKGVTGLQNIQLLKWCKEFGVTPQWNLLWGFPHEPPEEYARMAALLPLLTHLTPPQTASAIRIDRFSPNFDCAGALGFANIQPFPAYRHIYPFEPEVVANLAYYFTYGYREPQDVERYTADVVREVRRWQQLHLESDLFSIDLGSVLLVCDLRPGGQALVTLSGLQRLLYELCDTACPLATLRQKAGEAASTVVSATELDALLDPLLERGLMVREGTSYLSLAIPVGEYSPGVATRQKLQHLLAASAGSRAASAPTLPRVNPERTTVARA
jgi:ribosomal peptide maturation radical SAM protein 1